ncbi:MAG: hydrogenase iron-sulfur subunit [Halobacteriota archaeon]|nr:hydrogenase iron-sulfur subunit [Halobacteriota archaeon]
MDDKNSSALVVGGGIGGIQAALDLAEKGFKVYLIEKNPAIGGTLSQLDKQFPTNSCGFCKVLPVFNEEDSDFCIRRELSHPNIELITYADVTDVEGSAGLFEVTVRKNARFVKEDLCTACGLCADVCPIDVEDDFNKGVTKRKAIYVKYPLAVPNVYTIDMSICNKCGECVDICPTDAIELTQKEEIIKLKVGSVILSPGFEEFDPKVLTSYGYGIYPNVVTSTEFERMLSTNGLSRPSDGAKPSKIAFLQCMGSRDSERNYCSSACCMISLKESYIAKEIDPSVEPHIFFMDMRAFGKGYHQYYEDSKDMITFTRARVASLYEDQTTNNLYVRYEEGADIVEKVFDLVVLAAGQVPPEDAKGLSDIFKIELNEHGFCKTRYYSDVETTRDGIYVCGSFSSPKDIPDTVVQANAAAMKASELIIPESRRIEEQLDAKLADNGPKIGVFLCRYGDKIDNLDIDGLGAFVKDLSDVTSVEYLDYASLDDGMEIVKKKIVDGDVNRVVFGACAPYHYEMFFKNTLKDTSIDPAFIELVNLREQVALVHLDEPEKANKKAKDQLRMAIGRLRTPDCSPLPLMTTTINQDCLVIGGGISGLTASIALAGMGINVHLVEESPELGGKTLEGKYNLEGLDLEGILKESIGKVENSNLIHVYTNKNITGISGSFGNFTTKLSNSKEVKHGAIIVATGAQPYIPDEYMYGKDDTVLTQLELEDRVIEGRLDDIKTVVMVQCVGSRDEERPYCSRFCCSQAIKNALKIKENNPDINVYILYRDIMTYGFKEEYYKKACEEGIVFVRYDSENKPEIDTTGDLISVNLVEPITDDELRIETDLLVLSTGVIPNDNKKMADLLRVDLDENGFFKEANVKFRPLDSVNDGIFLCGLARSPGSVDESITQAMGAASRAYTLLSNESIQKKVRIALNRYDCITCQTCEALCVYGAAMLKSYGIADIDPLLCRGCGVCLTSCPAEAITNLTLSDNQTVSMMEEAISSHKNGEPRILAFLCKWCPSAAADMAGAYRFQYPSNMRTIKVACTGGIDPRHVIEAFSMGFDGVFVGACHTGDCHYMSGNEKAEHRIDKLKEILPGIGIDPERLKLEYFTGNDGKKFAEVVTGFTELLSELGPTPLAKNKEA